MWFLPANQHWSGWLLMRWGHLTNERGGLYQKWSLYFILESVCQTCVMRFLCGISGGELSEGVDTRSPVHIPSSSTMQDNVTEIKMMLRSGKLLPCNCQCFIPHLPPSPLFFLSVTVCYDWTWRAKGSVRHPRGRTYLLGDPVYLNPWVDPLFPLWPLMLGRDFLSEPYQSEAQRWNRPADQDLA